MNLGQIPLRMLYLDILAAAMLLTRIPIDWPQDETPAIARSYWAFPLIGVGVAAPPAILAGLLLYGGMPPLAAAMITLAGIALLTGGMHQDGLADVADALGGNDPEQRRAIMRDSSVGSFGIIGLMAVTIISVASLAAIAEGGGAVAMLHAMVSSAALSRAMMAGQRYLNPPPTGPGLASMTGEPPQMVVLAAVLAGGVVAISFSGIGAAFAMLAVGIAAMWGIGFVLKRLIGGVNGDGLGATQQITESLMLVILAMAAG